MTRTIPTALYVVLSAAVWCLWFVAFESALWPDRASVASITIGFPVALVVESIFLILGSRVRARRDGASSPSPWKTLTGSVDLLPLAPFQRRLVGAGWDSLFGLGVFWLVGRLFESHDFRITPFIVVALYGNQLAKRHLTLLDSTYGFRLSRLRWNPR